MRRFFQAILVVANAVIAALFLAAYFARFIQLDAFWWLELCAVFLPYVALLVAVAALALALAGRWRMMLFNALLLGLFLLRIHPFSWIGGSPGTSDDALSLLTFNVPDLWHVVGLDRTAAMAQLIGATNPDVVALQEASVAFFGSENRSEMQPHVSVLSDSLGFAFAFPDSSRAVWTPQPAFTRLQMVRQEITRWRFNPRDMTHTTIARSRIRWKDREFVLYNVHLRTFGERKPWREGGHLFGARHLPDYLRQYREAYRVRHREVEEIVRMVEREADPVILCGDLNSTPYNRVYARLAGVLRDAFAERGRGWGMTYHARRPLARIDYVFVSEEWDVVSARVVEDAYLSDHLPLLVRLRLRDGRGGT